MQASAAGRPKAHLIGCGIQRGSSVKAFDSVGKGDQPTDKQCDYDSDAIASTRTRRVRRQRLRMHPPRPWMWAKVDGSCGVRRAPKS